MKRALEEDVVFQAQCNQASENLLQLSQQWASTVPSTSFTPEQVLSGDFFFVEIGFFVGSGYLHL
jgi:hypothetical protein